MVLRGHIYSEPVQKQIVWDRGWSLEDTFWCLEARLHREMDLLLRVCPKPRYLTWWSLSNKYHNMIQASEIMAKTISHACLLKCDDVRLKHLPYGNRACSLCDLYLVQDIFHITIQYPGTQQLRCNISDECEQYPVVNEVFKNYDQDIMSVCLGRCLNDCSYDSMEKLWCITGKHIYLVVFTDMC